MKIGIVGMGPVGQILAVHMQHSGHEVAICDHGKLKINLIRKEGIHLNGKVKKHAYFKNAYTSLGEIIEQKFDVIIFAVKSHHMQNLLLELEGMAGFENTCVLSAQNGIDVEKILSGVFGESQTLRMVINFAGNLHAPNVVNVTFFNPPNYIASIDDSKQDITKRMADVLNKVGLETVFLDSFKMLDRIWEKTILNSSLSALCGISMLTIKEAMDFQDTMDVVEQVILEAIEVGKAEGIKFPENFVKLCLRYLKRAGNHFPSLAVDLLNRRDTEIDYFNGKIIEYGKKHYIRTPLNCTFTTLVKAATYRNALLKEQKKSQATSIVDF